MMPAARIINELSTLATCLRNDERYDEALDIDVLIEAANRSGHTTPSAEDVSAHVRQSMDTLDLSADTRELIDMVLD